VTPRRAPAVRGYRDPRTVHVGAFAAEEETLVVPLPGEILFRLR
jgi:hypothetical protein